MKHWPSVVTALALIVAGRASAEQMPKPRPMLTGLNLAGAEFGKPGGVHGTDYKYPDDADIDDIAERGFTIVRLPFLWEHLQPALNGDFDPDEAKRLDGVVAQARRRKLAIILNPHNYARWHGDLVGSDKVAVSAFADFWRRLAARYRGQDGVVFGLMNEPHDMRTEDWARAAQAAIDAIRDTKACNRILVPGNGWTGAHSWRASTYGTPNAVVMAGMKDPLRRTSFEFHQYLDSDWSGTAKTCQSPETVVAALSVATDWLNEIGATGFLGEIGAGTDPQCIAGLDAMLRHLDANAHVWKGWAAWSAGAWWPKDYPLLLRKEDGQDTPQLSLFMRWRAPPDPSFAKASCSR